MWSGRQKEIGHEHDIPCLSAKIRAAPAPVHGMHMGQFSQHAAKRRMSHKFGVFNMTLRTILVCLTSTSSAASLLKSAAILARRDNAHVIGLHISESLVVYPGIAMHIPDGTYEAFAQSQKGHREEIKAIFEAQTHAEDFPKEWRQMHSDTKPVSDCIVDNARSADLVIMAQDDATQARVTALQLPAHVIKESGRPVLVIPRDYTAETLGDTILLGWSKTPEATRAVHDMCIVASENAQVTLLRVDADLDDPLADFAANDIAAALTRHGLNVDVVHRKEKAKKVAKIISHEAFEMGADMLVNGAFGHSRTFDFVIGAVTHKLLAGAKIPVLFSK
ncbi:MAG: nucleotide-binding universal stress UspA family protein [Yoonia sp.]